MRMAAAYFRCGVVYLHSESITTEGVRIFSPPFVRVDWDDPDVRGKLNKAVASVIDGCREEVPHPTVWNLADPLYRLAGVKSWGAFVSRGCKGLRIEEESNRILLVPQENSKGGFSDCAEPIPCSEAELSDWKSLLEKAFRQCK